MIRKRKLIGISIVLVISFLISTNYLLSKLALESEVKTVQEKIHDHLEKLPNVYYVQKPTANDLFDNFLKHITSLDIEEDLNKVWEAANSWVSGHQLIDLESPILGSLLWGLKHAKIIKADLDTRGTQLKLLLTLEGHQKVVFKPKWYDIDTVIEGPVYAGKDRYFSEIIAFYMSVILNLPFTPCSVERIISFSQDILPVGTKRLLNTSFEMANRTCIYGQCFYCRKHDAVCEDEKYAVFGTVIFNVNASFKSHRSPWQRTYKRNKKATWEEDENYCKYVKQKLTKRRILDLVDVAIFDFLIQNGDRHHYETFYDNVVLIDNGKGFGNPYISHLDILAPLYQCCMLRNTTYKKLLRLAGGNLQRHLQRLPHIESLLTSSHIEAIEKRLLILYAVIEYCKSENRK